MIVFIFTVISLLVTFGVSLISFSDASQALSAGVFSNTSLIGYSITKSLALYAIFCSVGAILAGIYRLTTAKNTEPVSVDALRLPKITRNEWLVVGGVAVVLGIIALVVREKIFSLASLQGEEFYNLAALKEFGYSSFAIIYPYSIGNLFVARALQSLGVGLIWYKIALNTLALAGLYFTASLLTDKWKYRLGIFGLVVVMYIQPLISPSLHRNILRFLLPVFWLVGWYIVSSKTFQTYWKKVAIYSALHVGLLFFGSADTIVLGYVTYALWVALALIRKPLLQEVGAFVAAPIIAFVVLLGITGGAYSDLLTSQLHSIIFYSGHANASPYFNLANVWGSASLGAFVKNSLYAVLYYLPIVIIANLIIFLVLTFSTKRQKDASTWAFLAGLIVSFALSYRQNFGDASVGRIGITSASLIFATVLLLRFWKQEYLARIVATGSAVFFGLYLLVSLYFFRYSVVDILMAREAERSAVGLVPCSETFLQRELAFAGFTLCEKATIDELSQLREYVADTAFYVFDDTFSLYYLLSSRPVALIPTFYMAYSKEQILIERMKALRVFRIIVPRTLHFFGVPETALHNPDFMRDIKEYQTNTFVQQATLRHFKTYYSP